MTKEEILQALKDPNLRQSVQSELDSEEIDLDSVDLDDPAAVKTALRKMSQKVAALQKSQSPDAIRAEMEAAKRKELEQKMIQQANALAKKDEKFKSIYKDESDPVMWQKLNALLAPNDYDVERAWKETQRLSGEAVPNETKPSKSSKTPPKAPPSTSNEDSELPETTQRLERAAYEKPEDAAWEALRSYKAGERVAEPEDEETVLSRAEES